MSRPSPPQPPPAGGGRRTEPAGAAAPVSVGEALLLTAWLVIGQLLFGGIAVAAGITDFSGQTSDRLVLVAIQAAVLATALAWLAARGALSRVMAPRRPARSLDAALGLGVGLASFLTLVIALGALFQLLGDVEGPEQQALDDVAAGGLDALLAVTLAVLLAPVLEELVFRGGLHGSLRARVGVWPAALISSTVFAAIHLEVITSSPAFLVQLFVLGLIFVWLYERTGNLLAPVLAHLAFNAASLTIAYLAPQLEEQVARIASGGAGG
jgi:uncharacterized protein